MNKAIKSTAGNCNGKPCVFYLDCPICFNQLSNNKSRLIFYKSDSNKKLKCDFCNADVKIPTL